MLNMLVHTFTRKGLYTGMVLNMSLHPCLYVCTLYRLLNTDTGMHISFNLYNLPHFKICHIFFPPKTTQNLVKFLTQIALILLYVIVTLCHFFFAPFSHFGRS